jgi:hypothetical protein
MICDRFPARAVVHARVFLTTLFLVGLAWCPPVARGASGGVTLTPPTKTTPERKPPASLASLPAPKARGPLRILLVDDDWSPNNNPGDRHVNRGSDEVYRELVAAAVGRDETRWSVEIVETYKHGPAFERLRDFNVVIWYTGASYGGAPDNSAVLSREDEKVVRRYLEETGGAFILISPGYVNNYSYGSSWISSPYPFLKEVMGIDGFYGLAQRFSAGRVTAHDGAQYAVAHPGVAETQFSAVNSNGAAVVFTSTLDPRYTTEGASAVAVAHPYGGGRFVYVGFTLENIPAGEREKAFAVVLGASGLIDPAAVATTAPPVRVPVSQLPPRATTQTIVPPPAPPSAPPGPAPANVEIYRKTPGYHSLRWIATGMKAFEVYRRDRDGWKFLRGGFRELFYDDSAFVAPNSAYKVVAVYEDGRRGETIVEYPDPPQPQAPTGLRVWQTGPETIQVEWVNVPGLGRYRMFGPGVPAAGELISTGTLSNPGYGHRATMNFMPPGIHEIRVAPVYGDNLISPVFASARVAINSDRGRYRMLWVGAKVNRSGPDDLLDADGKGQEIFAGAFVAQAPLSPTGPATSLPSVRTVVYGDTQAFADRIRAGSAGPTGGLRAGDLVPSANVLMPAPGAAGETDRFPLRIWEGELIDTGPAVSVIPVLFEWGAVNHDAWTHYSNHWPVGNVLQKLGEAMRTNLRAPLAPQPLYGTWEVQDFSRSADEPAERRPSLVGFSTAAGRDRPIGLVNTSRPGQVPSYAHNILGFVLTRPRVEAALGGQSIVRLEQVWYDEFSGSYTGYFQIERLSAPPLVVPPAPPVATVVPVTPPLVVAGTAVIAPAPPTPAAGTATPTVTALPPGGARTGGQTIKPIEPPPTGPAPTQAMLSSESAARHVLRWQANGATSFDVLRQQGDGWITVAAATSFTMALDESFIAPGTVYQIVGRHADGRVGTTNVTAANPPQPKIPEGLAVVQTGERKVKVSWKPDSDVGSAGYRVFAPGLPADGQFVAWEVAPELKLEIPNVPEGTQRFRVAKQYGAKVAPVEAQVTGDVVAWRGQYRVVLLGFRVGRKTTDDDIFDGDGRGDEVFFGAYRLRLPPNGAVARPSLDFAQSAVMGDTNTFPTRIRAGQAGPTGGIRSGDIVPSAAALTAQLGIAAANDRLPMLLWQGELANVDDTVVVALTGFEWDNASLTPWNNWVGWWSSPNGSSMIAREARQAITATPDAVRFIPLTSTYEVEPTKPLIEDRLALPPAPGTGVPKEVRYIGFGIGGRPLVTRPLGAIKRGDPEWYCIPHGFALTRRNIEKTLRSGAAVVVEASLTTQRGPNVRIASEQDDSEYTVVVQLERIGGAPLYP